MREGALSRLGSLRRHPVVAFARASLVVLIALNVQPLFHAQRGGELEHTLRTFVMRLSAMLQAPAERPAKAGTRRSRAAR